jgi:hypothetical protein
MFRPVVVRKKARIVAFYGPLAPLQPEVLGAAIRRQLQALGQDTEKLLLLTELNSPAELVFARQALELRLPLVAVVPAKMEDLQKTSSPAAWTELEPILRQADRIEVLSDAERVMARGWKLVDAADLLLVFEQGDATDEKTAHLVRYVMRQGREVIALREKAGTPALDEVKIQEEAALPEVEFAALLESLGKAPPAAPVPQELDIYGKACSQEARKIAPVYRKYFRNVVLANAIAAMAGTVQVVFVPPHADWKKLPLPLNIPMGTLVETLIGIKLACVVIGAVIFLVLQIRKSQTRWINARLKAEMCRSARATWRLPRLTDALAMGGQPEARDTLQFIRYLRVTSKAGETVQPEQFKADYGFNRVQGQYRYYMEQADNATTLSHWLTPFYWVFTALSIFMALVVLIYPHTPGHHGEAPGPGHLSYFFIGFIPIMAPALASWILAWDAIETLGRRKARYREMQAILHRALADLVQADTWEEVTEVVERTEKLLLSEVLEWYSFIKYSK